MGTGIASSIKHHTEYQSSIGSKHDTSIGSKQHIEHWYHASI
jgi:hypothetical protein